MSERRNALLKGFDENKGFMKTKVERGIAQNRMGVTRLQFTDSCGEPIKNADKKKNAEIAIDNIKIDQLTPKYLIEVKKSDISG